MTPGKLMGAFAEETARAYQFTREDMDAYAMESLSRARRAVETGAFERGDHAGGGDHAKGRGDRRPTTSSR